MAFITLVFPLVFLAMMGLATGEEMDPLTGAPAIQSHAPVAAMFAGVMAAFVMMPYGISRAREQGVLKRLRGTPLSTSVFLAGRISAAMGVALLGAALMLGIAVVAFGLDLPVRLLPALTAVLVVGVLAFAAVGFAVVMLLRTSGGVMTFTMGSFLLMAFASGAFAPTAPLPRLLDTATWFLPVRPFATAITDTFVVGTPAWSHLAILACWGLAGAAVGVRRWTSDPARARQQRGRRTATAVAALGADQPPALRAARLVAQQARHANRQVWRDPASAFFVIAFPVLFTIVVPYAFGHPVIEGVRFAALVTPAMTVFAVVVAAYVNMPEAVAIQRGRGVLKRLRGTPLPAAAYVAGRLGSVLWISALAATAVLVAGWAVHDVRTAPSAWAPLAIALLLGTATMAALGLAVTSRVRDAKAVPAVSLGTFLPLAFISDMLAFGMQMPGPLATLGWVFPIKHLVHAVDAASQTSTLAWDHLGIIALWGAAGTAVAIWRFRWDAGSGT